jgi:hypothetical protein
VDNLGALSAFVRAAEAPSFTNAERQLALALALALARRSATGRGESSSILHQHL